MKSVPPGSYPPRDHLIRALRIRMLGEEAEHIAPVVPHVCAPGAGARAEFFAMLVDLAGADAAALAARPDGTATRALALHLLHPISAGEAHAQGRVLRSGRTGLEVEVRVTNGSGKPLAHADVSYARVAAPAVSTPADSGQPGDIDWTLPGMELTEPLRAYLGIHVGMAESASCEVQARNSNSMGSLHGGAQASLIAAAAENAAGADGTFTAHDLRIHFLSHARKGPVEARARMLRKGERECLVRVETFDLGDDSRAVAVATVSAVRCPDGARHPI